MQKCYLGMALFELCRWRMQCCKAAELVTVLLLLLLCTWQACLHAVLKRAQVFTYAAAAAATADGKFACTYCGAQVAMTQAQRIAQAQQPPHGSSGAAAAAAAPDDATAKAIAFKDRLVDYDRHSQKRTTVIDNQSDYFEIDTNAWLSEDVRTMGRHPRCCFCCCCCWWLPFVILLPYVWHAVLSRRVSMRTLACAHCSMGVFHFCVITAASLLVNLLPPQHLAYALVLLGILVNPTCQLPRRSVLS
jgi:hypothetical protein